MRVHALASMPHYAEHLEAIFKHLHPDLKGEARYGARVNSKGLDPADVVMIAGFYDFDRVPDNKIIYVEHGAGQSYRGDPRSLHHPAYHGSPHHPQRVIGYLCPRPQVAALWDKPAFWMGSPVCDPHVLGAPLLHYNPVVTITFHWNASRICPEAGSALEWYAPRLGEIVQRLRSKGFIVWGHHHPRDHRLPLMWKRLGVDVVDVNRVRAEADMLICDNSSLMYEMSYLGRQVVALNAPWFRREVDHGLRFWNWPGLMADDAEALISWEWNVSLVHTHAALAATDAYGKALSDGGDGRRAAAWVTSQVFGL